MADKMLKIELKKSLIGRGAKQIATAEWTSHRMSAGAPGRRTASRRRAMPETNATFEETSETLPVNLAYAYSFQP